MACNCIETVNGLLASRNTRLVCTMSLSTPIADYPKIDTEQIDRGRGKPKAALMVPSFCPFCGVKYRAED